MFVVSVGMGETMKAGEEMHTNFGVYALVDPDTDVVMYIGKAVDIRRRYKQHCDNRDHGSNLRKAQWMYELHMRRQKPVLRILCSFSNASIAELDEAEIKLIQEYKARGQAELNIAKGGGGRTVVRALNASQDDWIELGSILKRVRAELASAAHIACKVATTKSADRILKALNLVDVARADLDTRLERAFPQWEEARSVFYAAHREKE